MSASPEGAGTAEDSPVLSLSNLLLATHDVVGSIEQDLWWAIREDEDRKLFEMIEQLKEETP